jgi:branched-subunit amino acid ABC-type transport system permease component
LADYYAQLVLNGVVAGAIYALFAVGLTMVYGVFRSSILPTGN